MDDRTGGEVPADLSESVREVLAALLRGLDDVRAAEVAGELARWLTAEAEARRPQAPADGEPEPEPIPRVLRLGGQEVTVATAPGQAAAAAPPPRRPAPPAGLDLAAFAEPEPAPRSGRDWAREVGDSIQSTWLKVRACELALRGDRSSGEPGADRELHTLIEEARGRPRCYLWPLDPKVALPERPLLELCARAYENLARALEVLQFVPRWATVEEQADEDFLQLMAEVQSSLYWALDATDLGRDEDQLTAFAWVKEQTSVHRVYLPRFMSRDTGADPTQWHDTATRLEEIARRLRDTQAGRRERKRLLDKLRYHLGRLEKTEDEDLRRGEWRKVLRVLAEWVAGGRQPSSRDVCDPLVDVVDELPGDLEVPGEARRVLLALDEQIAARERAAQPRRRAPQRPSPEVAAARELLAGKVVLLIGGHRRASEAERLERDLGLAELRWVGTRSHRSLDPLIEEIQKADVDLVVIAPRWSDHAFNDLRPVAQKAGKPFLVLPGGYGTNRVAHEVMGQVSEQLRG